MLDRVLADLVLIVHVVFIGFVIFGGLLAVWWRTVMWIHVPTVIWTIMLEFFGWICPLTPLEKILREAAGTTAYDGSFVEHYLVLLLYPPGLTREVQLVLAAAVLLINLVVYGLVWRLRRQGK
jgi:hypothetical protein